MVVGGNGRDTSPVVSMPAEFFTSVWVDNVGCNGDIGMGGRFVNVYVKVVVLGRGSDGWWSASFLGFGDGGRASLFPLDPWRQSSPLLVDITETIDSRAL